MRGTRCKIGMLCGDGTKPEDSTSARQKHAFIRITSPLETPSGLERSIVQQASPACSKQQQHLPASWTLMSSVPKEERLLPVAEALEPWSFSQLPMITFCARLEPPPVHSRHSNILLRRNVREYLLPPAVWGTLRPGSPPDGAIDRDWSQQWPCLDIEAAASRRGWCTAKLDRQERQQWHRHG